EARLVARVVRRAEVDLDEQLLLHVVAPREHPRAERDREAEHEHPDQDGDRRRHRGRHARPHRPDRLPHDEPDPHSVVYPPRRSSRARRPPSSAITRLRILSTISRSWVTIRIVVPDRLIR